VTVRSGAGEAAATFEVERAGGTISITRQGGAKPWQVLLAGAGSIRSVEGGEAQETPQGILLKAAEDTHELRIS
jgi:hypothetical protein